LGLAAAGFMWSRQSRSIGPAALIALSIAIKPIVILLPLALLIRSDSRKTGWWAIGWIVGLMALAQAFLAWRARNLRDLSPIPALQTFLERPIQWACHPENYSLYSLVCRASGGQYFSWQRLVTTAGVLLLILMAVDVIRGHPGRSWVIFAFACLLSPMVSPIAWSHYQILLLPMFVLLAAQFALRAGHRIVVVMPAYNAARTLQNSWQQIPKPWVDQVILVDDGSRDGTAELARTLPLDVISHPHNVGYGGNQKTCYMEALRQDADVVVMLHPDGQYDGALIPEL